MAVPKSPLSTGAPSLISVIENYLPAVGEKKLYEIDGDHDDSKGFGHFPGEKGYFEFQVVYDSACKGTVRKRPQLLKLPDKTPDFIKKAVTAGKINAVLYNEQTGRVDFCYVKPQYLPKNDGRHAAHMDLHRVHKKSVMRAKELEYATRMTERTRNSRYY